MNHPVNELDTSRLTRNELGAMLEHLFYQMEGKGRVELAKRMPDAYQRLTGQSDGSMACLLSKHIKYLREAGAKSVAADSTYHNGHNDHLLMRYAQDFGGVE